MRATLFVSCWSLLVAVAEAQDWHPVPGKLSTQWAAGVTPQNAWPEYPRPTMVREKWQNLNGLWDYAITAGDAAAPEKADGRILVPFAIESSLSGVGKPLRPDQRLWYRRQFTVPQDSGWVGKHVLLHFDAVDWETEVWVDGHRLGDHRGGYDRFSFDITEAMGAGVEHTLLVSVRDPSDQGPQPRGKQVLQPNGIWYTPCSGIWQTVWLEPVPKTWIKAVHCEPEAVNDAVTLRLEVVGAEPGDAWEIREVVDELMNPPPHWPHGPVEKTLYMAEPRLWCAEDPWLAPVAVSVSRHGEVVDRVSSFIAMRHITVGKDSNGTTRLLLNRQPLFQFGPLDQGFWPDGIYTPPSYAAMCSDLDAIQKMGCNMLRKHVKVESELFYHECDKRGILVWQDMPSGETQRDPAVFERELRALIVGRGNHPSIVMWVVFNEGWGQHETQRYVDLVRQLDPTRLVGNASGWTDQKCGDVIDVHSYPGPAMAPVEAARASVCGEFGGLGLPLAGHTWVDKNNWGYVSFKNPQSLTDEYVRRLEALHPLIAQGLSAAVYTQTTDVEIECNGWLTYDRAVAKIDPERAAAAARKLYEPHGTLAAIVPTALQAAQEWRYTTLQPGQKWVQAGFDDSGWTSGASGFGTEGTPGARVGTRWAENDIWLRRTVELPATPLSAPQWCVHHDEDAEVFFDGQLALQQKGYTTGYGY
ncbi:MAG TPA: glycoside hydrolase family 2 TIM barrel-domain containing protein, partial [Planctomycetota bacterium]|nr:glycoside hydrolase family 2 TIM barrel-domain containing protein [Planctomycetota bacterium]